MKTKLLMLLCAINLSYAKDIYVEKYFIDGTHNHPNVNPAVMKIISMAESNGNPNTISFLAFPEQAQPVNVMLYKMGVKYKVKAYDSRRYIFNVWPTAEEASGVLQALRLSKIESYDIGLMQVNSQNAKKNGWDELKLLTNMTYNIDKGSKILSDCMSANETIERSIECYNKGTHKEYSYSYYQHVFEQVKR